MGSREYVSIDDLLIWSDNPRHGLQVEDTEGLVESEIINILIDVVGPDKMYNLLEDIFISKRLMENITPVVVPHGEKYFVYDGNRRVSVLKILLNPSIVENDELRQKIVRLIGDADITFAKKVFVFITNRVDALELMDKMHSGEQDGVGMIPWESFQRDVSMNNREKPVKYPYAFRVARTLKYNRKSHFKIPYTDLDRLFRSPSFQECFSLSNVSDNEFASRASYAIEMLQKYKSLKRFKSFSREFNTTDTSSDTAAMSVFCDWVKQKEKEKNNIHFEVNFVELFEGQSFSFEQMNLHIYGADRSEIFYENSDIYVNYQSPNGTLVDKIDTNVCGTWIACIRYRNSEYTSKITVKELLHPKIDFAITRTSIRVGNTLNLRDLITKATDGYGKDRKSDIIISGLGETKVIGDVLTGDNPIGKATVSFSFVDVTGEPFSTTKDIDVIDQSQPLVAADGSSSLLTFSANFTVDISEVVNKLVKEINNLEFDSNICLITSSLRTLVELSFDELAARSIVSFSNKADLCSSIEDFKTLLLSAKLSDLCQNYRNILPSFKSEQNVVRLFDSSEISSLLNLAAHKSIARIDKTKIREKAKSFIVPVLVYTTLLLK